MRLATVTEQPIAAARQQTTIRNVSRDIRRLLEAPWVFIRAHPDLRRDGHNVALYGCDGSVEVGVQVVRTFADTDAVVCSSTPAGTVATTAYFGPYAGLGAAHDAVQAWARAEGLGLTGVSWEVYGDWTDDPAKLRTDVFWLVG